MKNLVIIPAYNEEGNITNLVSKVRELSYDYLVINDASKDHTMELLKENHINHLDLAVNSGIASVTQIGFRYAVEHGYDGAIVIDGDGQHPPMYIKTLMDGLEKGYDYVVGSRYVIRKKPWNSRMVGSRIIAGCIFLKTGVRVTDPTSGMRALGGKVMKDFSENMNFIAEPDALTYVIKKKYHFTEVQVTMDERDSGASYFSGIMRSFSYMVRVLISILFVQ